MANIITCVRVLCGILLVFFAPFSQAFYWIYVIGGVSDVLDGIVARRFGLETKFGAQLDTIADVIFSAVVIVRVVQAVSIQMWLCIWIICIAVIKGINVICGFAMYNRFVSEHTVMNKLCGILLFVIPLCIGNFTWQPVAVLIILTCIMATFAAVQEGHYIRTGKHVV